MFRDEEDILREEVIQLLKVSSLEDLLDECDITAEDAVVKLILDGHIILPEIRPL